MSQYWKASSDVEYRSSLHMEDERTLKPDEDSDKSKVQGGGTKRRVSYSGNKDHGDAWVGMGKVFWRITGTMILND